MVVEHWIPSPHLYIHTVANRCRLQHLHHLLVRYSQHADVIDVHQDVRYSTKEGKLAEISVKHVEFFFHLCGSV